MPLRHTRLFTAALVLMVGLTSACASGEEVGDASLLEFDQEQAERLGATTSTVAPADGEQTTETTAAQHTGTTAPPQATTTLPPEKQEVTIEVAVNDRSPYFDPALVQVLVNSKVRFVNKGSQTYRVVSDVGAFDSGPIPPGGAWIWDAAAPGRYNYSDAGRPFAVGAIEVTQ